MATPSVVARNLLALWKHVTPIPDGDSSSSSSASSCSSTSGPCRQWLLQEQQPQQQNVPSLLASCPTDRRRSREHPGGDDASSSPHRSISAVEIEPVAPDVIQYIPAFMRYGNPEFRKHISDVAGEPNRIIDRAILGSVLSGRNTVVSIRDIAAAAGAVASDSDSNDDSDNNDGNKVVLGWQHPFAQIRALQRAQRHIDSLLAATCLLHALHQPVLEPFCGPVVVVVVANAQRSASLARTIGRDFGGASLYRFVTHDTCSGTMPAMPQNRRPDIVIGTPSSLADFFPRRPPPPPPSASPGGAKSTSFAAPAGNPVQSSYYSSLRRVSFVWLDGVDALHYSLGQLQWLFEELLAPCFSLQSSSGSRNRNNSNNVISTTKWPQVVASCHTALQCGGGGSTCHPDDDDDHRHSGGAFRKELPGVLLRHVKEVVVIQQSSPVVDAAASATSAYHRHRQPLCGGHGLRVVTADENCANSETTSHHHHRCAALLWHLNVEDYLSDSDGGSRSARGDNVYKLNDVSCCTGSGVARAIPLIAAVSQQFISELVDGTVVSELHAPREVVLKTELVSTTVDIAEAVAHGMAMEYKTCIGAVLYFDEQHVETRNKLVRTFGSRLFSGYPVAATAPPLPPASRDQQSLPSPLLLELPTCVVFRNAVRSVVDVWPPTVKFRQSLQRDLQRECELRGGRPVSVTWWVDLSSNHHSGRNCLEQVSDSSSSGELYRYHDEVRVIACFTDFAAACRALTALGDTKVCGRKVIAHFALAPSASPDVQNRASGDGRDVRFVMNSSTASCDFFAPNVELEPVVDATTVALDTDDC